MRRFIISILFFYFIFFSKQTACTTNLPRHYANTSVRLGTRAEVKLLKTLSYIIIYTSNVIMCNVSFFFSLLRKKLLVRRRPWGHNNTTKCPSVCLSLCDLQPNLSRAIVQKFTIHELDERVRMYLENGFTKFDHYNRFLVRYFETTVELC